MMQIFHWKGCQYITRWNISMLSDLSDKILVIEHVGDGNAIPIFLNLIPCFKCVTTLEFCLGCFKLSQFWGQFHTRN